MSETAAFFRFEGTFSARPTLAAAAWLAAHARELPERVLRLGHMAFAAPFVLTGLSRDPARSARLTWMGLRDMSEDRLVLLGEEYAMDFLVPSLRPRTLGLLHEARRAGQRPVLISDNLDVVLAPVAKHLGIEDYVCNHMELRNQKATGRLRDPVMSGQLAGPWARRFAEAHAISLDGSSGYGTSADDGALLTLIGKPCAIRPDGTLRAMANALHWPVVEP